ncbi:hypothetical protein E4U42_003648 [Claviceps africana]|uniref:Zn(2)-C6 fungal-type domain-containing protein n=1 Tax=Claviceps africana TaxID=83212 RepID=A0A8K0J6A0_9HYPO|nr:hypothetical protein E4U42_003648 [Claviceps africana]
MNMSDRRVKCDEIYPFCVRCLSHGKLCGGPQAELGVGYKPPTWYISTEPTHQERALKALELFHSLTVDHVTKFYTERICSPEMLEIANIEPAISQALVATNTYYLLRAPENRANTSEMDVVGNNAYIRALQEIQKLGTEPNHPMSFLTSCVIFLVIEILRGESSAALGLLQNGLNLVGAFEQEQAQFSLVPEEKTVTVLNIVKSFLGWVKAQAHLASQQSGVAIFSA